MGNIKNYNFNKLDLRLSNDEYWDFFLGNDEGEPDCSSLEAGTCQVVWYDFNQSAIYGSSTDSIYSLVTWDQAVNTGYTLNTIGLTGIDNGRIVFEKGTDPTNPELLEALTGSTLIIPPNDMRLNLNRVTGTTGNFSYETNIISDPVAGDLLELKGGFYQGFYKVDGETYEVLPTRVDDAWSAEFWLKRQNLSTQPDILNNTYPNNKGFFFYMGTRAENKFWNVWEGADTGCTAACTADTGCTDVVSTFCTVPKESEISIVGDYGLAVPLDPPQVEIDLITNGFLIYGRAHDGRPDPLTQPEGTTIYTSAATQTSGETCNVCRVCNENHDGLGAQTVCTYDGKGIAVVRTSEVITNHTNPFLIYGRATKFGVSHCNCSACNGPSDNLGNETVCSFSGRTSPQSEVNYNLDIIDNALGFRIKDDGSIGYRLLTVTGHCETNEYGENVYVSGVTVEEKYSEPNMVPFDEWSYIAIRFVTDYKSPCDLTTAHPRKGKLMIYVNGFLKFIDYEFDELVARRLHEYKLKQVGVPFNFSLGGGSQGLLESQTFDGLDPNDRGLPIEQNFAGTFIGQISQFKFNICDLSLCKLRNQYNLDLPRYS
ncbi:MAG: hypothetical protein E6R13_02935 [Spirochaetes bacterium]|nr:MAG: hypothetical protein E6R13_02935 [Spirochaetota bacterium]